MQNKNLFTSKNQNWRTPKKLYAELDKEFNFTFDPSPPRLKRFLTGFDAFKHAWGKRNFINPPYTTTLQNRFLKKGYEESLKGKLCVFLIPVRTSSIRWHKYIFPHAKEIRFLDHRLKFSDKGGCATFDSAIIVFDGRKKTE